MTAVYNIQEPDDLEPLVRVLYEHCNNCHQPIFSNQSYRKDPRDRPLHITCPAAAFSKPAAPSTSASTQPC